MDMRDIDVAVIGAGVVGLAAACRLAAQGRSVLILERESGIGRGVTSRNSEVIHAGIYYPAESLKARLCTRGRVLLYEWCVNRGVAHRKVGKLIVAAGDAETEILADLKLRAEVNGVPGLRMLDGRDIARLEPQVRGDAALLSPETGIVDTAGLALSLLATAEAHGAFLSSPREVVALEQVSGGWRLETRAADGSGIEAVVAGGVVNAAGLESDRMAALAGIDVDARGYRLKYCKGDYFIPLPGKSPVLERLIYPLPGRGGLGIHATLDLAGRIRFGPDAEYVDRIDFGVSEAKAEDFGRAIRRYLPSLRSEWLRADCAGIRPKLAGPGEDFRDFVVAEESATGFPGLVNCIGIESPGLTAALAIAERIAELLPEA
jgi:L-2-hydroxyglutarate oxidase LhgO